MAIQDHLAGQSSLPCRDTLGQGEVTECLPGGVLAGPQLFTVSVILQPRLQELHFPGTETLRLGAKLLAIAALLGLALANAEVTVRLARAAEDRTVTATAPNGPLPSGPLKPPAATEKAAPKADAPIESPPINYVRDKEGRLVPLLGFTWEELQELIQQKQRARNSLEPPRAYDLQQVVITAEATDNRVELTATYKIRLDDDKWVDVPLISGSAVLTEPAQYQGPGEQVVNFDSMKGAYSVRLRGPPRSSHSFTIKCFAPLKNVGGHRRLELDLPAAAASKMSLQVPLDNVAVTANTGAVAAEVKRLGKGKSEINAWGLGGPLSLEWKKGAGTVAASTSRLVADGQIKATLDNRSLRFEVSFTVRSLAEEFDRFQIKLPPETKYSVSEVAPTGYTLSGGMDDSRIVAVQLWQKTKGPVEVKFQAERAYESKDPNEALELAAFEVVEAIPYRQTGHIAVVVSSDLQATFEKSDRVRQVEELPAALPQKGAFGFEYHGQPASLSVKVSPRRTNISVEPEYVYHIEPDRIRLDAKFKYVIRGAKALDLNIDMPGWIPEPLDPKDGVDDEYWSGEGPIHLTHGVSGKYELSISAYRRRSGDFGKLELSLPSPHANRIEDALVVIDPADNVRVRPVDDALIGLSRIAAAGNLKLPSREQPPLVFRADQAQAKFVATTERLPQSVSATADGTINVRQDGIQVEQRFQFRVEHEPLGELVFDVPKQLSESDANLEIVMDDKTLSMDDKKLSSFEESSSDADSPTVAVHAPLPMPRSGIFTVSVKFRQPIEPMNLESGEPVSVALVMPQSASLTVNRLAISHDAALSVWPYDDRWSFQDDNVSDSDDHHGIPALRLMARQALPELLLNVGREQRRSTGTTVVERAWVQTWLAGGVRQDRAVYQITTADDQIGVTLPEGVALNRVELKVDNKEETIGADSQRKLIVRLPPQTSGSHVLELKYQFADSSDDTGSIAAELPRFADTVWVQHFYWQLVLPSNRHLVKAAEPLTPEFTWQWNGACWERRSVRDQAELENWIGIEHGAELPPSTNRYLFSMAGSPKRLTAWVAGRGELLFAASLAVLVCGLSLIRFQLFRRPIALFAVGVAVAALAAWQVESALLFLQAALVGIVLLLLAMLLEYLQTRRRPSPSIVRSAGSSIIESRSATMFGRSDDAIAPASTESLPVDLEIPAAESSSR